MGFNIIARCITFKSVNIHFASVFLWTIQHNGGTNFTQLPFVSIYIQDTFMNIREPPIDVKRTVYIS